MISDTQYKALKIIIDHPTVNAKGFAQFMWGETDTNMFTKHSNQGHGACSGKAAWLCAGSYTGRLQKLGLVTKYRFNSGWVCLTDKGREEMQCYEQKIKKL